MNRVKKQRARFSLPKLRSGGRMRSGTAIGVSTRGFTGLGMDEALSAIIGAGYEACELYLAANPGMPVIWPRQLNRTNLRRLKDKLPAFKRVTVRCALEGTNICDANPGFREESVRQYNESLEFAAAIGAEAISFPPGKYPSHKSGVAAYVQTHQNINRAFAGMLAAKAAGLGIRAAFQCIDQSSGGEYQSWNTSGFKPTDLRYYADYLELLPSSFGLELDISTGVETDPDKTINSLLKYIPRLAARLVAVRVYGLFIERSTFYGHSDLRRNNSIDYPVVLRALKAAGFTGPFIIDVIMKDVPTLLRKSREFKELIERIWLE